GAAAAVRAAAALAAAQGGELVVVTPGMIELGPLQAQRNRELAAQVAAAGGHLIVVGRTNRRALLEGAAGAAHPPVTVERLAEAARLAPEIAGERGVILYENDVPDHYP